MSKLTPSEFQAKHAKNLKGAISDMTAGINRVTEAPTKKAAAASAKMLANLSESVTSGRWAGALNRVTLEEWRAKMITKGVPRVSGGIDAAAEKVIDFATQLLPAVDAAVNKVRTMPDLTLEDNIGRMTTYIREMAKFHKK